AARVPSRSFIEMVGGAALRGSPGKDRSIERKTDVRNPIRHGYGRARPVALQPFQVVVGPQTKGPRKSNFTFSHCTWPQMWAGFSLGGTSVPLERLV